MSADNFFVVTRHPDGGYAAVMGFASDDNFVPIATGSDRSFDSVDAAFAWAEEEGSEYGTSLDENLRFGPPRFEYQWCDATQESLNRAGGEGWRVAAAVMNDERSAVLMEREVK